MIVAAADSTGDTVSNVVQTLFNSPDHGSTEFFDLVLLQIFCGLTCVSTWHCNWMKQFSRVPCDERRSERCILMRNLSVGNNDLKQGV